ncbi:septum formation family protein [Phycicoccus avicenniae]|uniref:DUF4190 domain-containing protein n=1 Tax=Phycicoccus avicenniae TaxID=2828860 RepID=UPI003D2D61C7
MSEPPTTPPSDPMPSWSAAPAAPPVEQWRGPSTPDGRHQPGTNGFAIASLVLGMIGGVLLSVVFGCVALGQVRRSGQAGRGLAIAGLVLSGLWVVGILAFVVFAVAGSASRADDGAGGGAGTVSATDLRIGDCVGELSETDDLGQVPAVPCDAPHHGEVFARFDLADGDYPAEDELDRLAGDGCFDRLADFAPAAADDPTVDVFYSFPQARGWRLGDHEVMCFAVSTEGRLPAGSIVDRTPAPVDA